MLAVTSESGPAAVRPGWRGVVRGRDHCTMTDTIALVLPLAAPLAPLAGPLGPDRRDNQLSVVQAQLLVTFSHGGRGGGDLGSSTLAGFSQCQSRDQAMKPSRACFQCFTPSD